MGRILSDWHLIQFNKMNHQLYKNIYLKKLTGIILLMTSSLYSYAQAEKIYTDLNEALKNPDNVYHITLNGHQLQNFPTQITQFTNLRTLDLSGSFANPGKITTIPKKISNLTHLLELKLRYNKIQHVPEELFELSRLNILDLSANHLQNISTKIGKLTHLQYLDLSRNQIKDFPESITQLSQLKELNLSRNKASHIPQQMHKLPAMQRLDISENKIISIPEGLGTLNQLVFLDASNNQLKKLPPTLLGLNRLSQLKLDENPYVQIPEELELWLSQREYGNSKEIPQILIQNRIQSEKIKNEALIQAQIADREKENALNQARIAQQEKQKAELAIKVANEKEKITKLRLEEESKRRLLEASRKKAEIETLKKQKELENQAVINEKKDIQIKNQRLVQYLILGIAMLIILSVLSFVWILNRGRIRQQTMITELAQTTKELEASREVLTQQAESLQSQKDVLEEKNETLVHLTDQLNIKTHELEDQAEELRQQKDSIEQKSQELEALTEELRQQNEVVEAKNQKLEALQSTKDLMISAVNHDLRNPLNPIINFSGDYPKKTEKERLSEIHTHAHLMLKLIDNIMQVYRADTLKIQATPNSPHQAIQEAIGVMSVAQSRKPRIINEVSGQLLANFDYNYIERVFENLLSNAIKYTAIEEKGGLVRFFAKIDHDEKFVRIFVQDNGKGIPKDKFESIFLPFVNPDAKSIGSAKSVGIGLTFCKTIVEAHKSKIDIESIVGEGTTFSFLLPYVIPKVTKQKIEKEALKVILLNTDEYQQLLPQIEEIKGYGFNNARLKRYLKQMDVGHDVKLTQWKEALLKAKELRDKEAFEKMLKA